MASPLEEIASMTPQEFADSFVEVPITPMQKLRVGMSCARDCLQRAKDGTPPTVHSLREIDYTYRQIVRAKRYVDKILSAIEKAAEAGIKADERRGATDDVLEENKSIVNEWKMIQ